MKKLTIKNLHTSINDKKILKDINLEINAGDIIAVVGPNGHGKSTLVKVLTHHYMTEITKGNILIDDQDIEEWETDEISRAGLFLAPQTSEEIPGVLMIDFLKTIINVRRDTKISLPELYKLIQTNIKSLEMNNDLLHRFVNQGFSGGEKKKCEILQMKLSNPDFVMLDEIDSGLDVDSLRIVVREIKNWFNKNKALIIISHHEKLFKEIIPTKVIVVYNGRIAKQGGFDILERIYKEGYSWVAKELGDKK